MRLSIREECRSLWTRATKKNMKSPLYFMWACLAALFIALAAQVSIPFTFSPIPVTLQTYAVLVISALLGSWWAVVSVVIYLTMGALGLPFFSGGTSGLSVLIGPGAGYLVGFIPMALIAGWNSRVGFLKQTLLFLLATLVTLLLGVIWLGTFVGWPAVLMKGFYPFIPGGILKALLAALTLIIF